MAQRWKAIINRNERYKVTLSSWAAVRGLFLRIKTGITFASVLRKKVRMVLSNNLPVGFISILRQKAKFIINSTIEIGFKSVLKTKGLLYHNSGFQVSLKAYLHGRLKLKFITNIGIDFVSKFTRKRALKSDNSLKVGFKSPVYKRGRLKFDNRKLTIYTTSLLKKLTIGNDLKQRELSRWKRDYRTIPQFRIVFYANLQKRRGD